MEPYYPKGGQGRPPRGVEIMLRMYLLRMNAVMLGIHASIRILLLAKEDRLLIPPLLPGYNGLFCLSNGHHFDKVGNSISAHCGECDYMMCCMEKTSEYAS